MAIQWFPGHMHLTRKAIEERVKGIDVVIELLDARLPGSSANPMLSQMTRGRPALKVLNKQDLADPERTRDWLDYYSAQPGVHAIALDASQRSPSQALVKACHQLAPQRGGLSKPMRVLICGIPNVGKSTLINTLKGRRAAATGDEAGVTRVEQRITIADDFYLYDTPGVLWPRIIVAQSGYNLAASGAVGRNAFDDQEVALELLNYLRLPYAGLLESRYQITGAQDQSDEALLEAIGRRRGALQGGGKVNLQKAAELVIHDFRSGAMGRITLETPDEFRQWLLQGKKLDAERQLRKEALEQARFIRVKKLPRAARGAAGENAD